MKKTKIIAFFVSLLFVWWIVFDWLWGIVPFLKRKKENQLQRYLASSSPVPDILIIYNSGGWGNTSLEKATDFLSIIIGIQDQLNRWGYKTLVVPYKRTRENIFSKVGGIKEALSYFRSQSKQLGEQINEFLQKNPDKKVILTGLSMGAFFVDETLNHIKNKDSVLAIKVGVPFYSSHYFSKNVIEVNDERDALVYGGLDDLFLFFVKGSYKWLKEKIRGRKMSFSRAMGIPGHLYSWDTPFVKEKIASFLKKQLPILTKT